MKRLFRTKFEKDYNPFKSGLLKLTWDHFISYPHIYVLAMASLVITHSLQSEIPGLAKKLGDLAGKGHQDQIDIKVLLLTALGIIVFRSLSRILFFFPARDAQKFLRLKFLDHFQHYTPWRWLSKYNPGQLFQMTYHDLEGVRALMGFGLLQVMNFILAMVILTPKILEVHPKLIYAFTPMAAALVVFALTSFKNQYFNKEVQNQQGEVQNFIIESYQGKKTIKTFGREREFIHKFNQSSEKELEFFFKIGRFRSFVFPLMDYAVALSFIWGAYLVWSLNLPSSELIFLSGFIFLFEEPLSFIGWIGVVFGRSLGCWQRLQEAAQAIEFSSTRENDISHAQKINQPLSLPFWKHSVKIPNQYSRIGIIGPTAVGKSHLLENLAYALRLENKSVSLVAQNPYLYNDTIETNLFLGRSYSPEEEKLAKELIEIMGLTELSPIGEIFRLQVGENGKKISGGQAKRVALVRSLLSEAEVLLWDDPMSSVDVMIEKSIWNYLSKQNQFSQKQIIFTTHRLSSFKQSQWGILLDKEEGILASGNPHELLNIKEQKVYEFFQHQMV